MLQTFFVYLLLVIIMMYFSYVGRAKKQWKYMVYGIAFFGFIFGVRYGVGKDFFSYMFNFLAYHTTSGAYSAAPFEIGFRFLTATMSYSGVHYTVFFSVIAFIQLYFTLLAFKKEYNLYPYLVFAFLMMAHWLPYSNTLRQIISVGLWFYAIKFLVERKVWKHYLLILIGITMHNSTVILLLFYPIYSFKQEWFKNIKIQFACLAGSLVLMKVGVIQMLLQQIEMLLTISGYDVYNSDGNADKIEADVNLGLGFIIMLVLNVLLIYNSNKTKEYYKSKYLTFAYDAFILGIILKYIFISSMLFSRLNYFFSLVNFIIAAYTMHYAHRENKKLYYAIVALLVFTFYATVSKGEYNTSLYLFFWQDDMHYIKSITP